MSARLKQCRDVARLFGHRRTRLQVSGVCLAAGLSLMSKAGLEAERAALLAEYRLLMEEQKIALGLPDDIAAKQWLLERLKDYEKRYAAFRHKVEPDGGGL